MTIDILDIITAVILNLAGTGLLGKYLLQQHREVVERDLRRLQSALDRTILVHRVQFESEFEALKEIWATISRLRAALSAVRPTSSIVPRDDTKDQKLERLNTRVQAFSNAHNEALIAIDDLSPFYPSDIFEAVEKLVSISSLELTEVQVETPFEADWFKRGRKHRDEFLAQARVVSGLIRKRLDSLAVHPSK